MTRKIVLIAILVAFAVVSSFAWAKTKTDPKSEEELRAEIAKLQTDINLLKQQNDNLEQKLESLAATLKPFIESAEMEKRQQAYRTRYNERADKDLKFYSEKELADAEKLYQPANKEFSDDTSKNLETLLKKYPKSNRAGCGALYLGQRLSGDKKVEYLKLAIDKYGDSFYGDGVQVGAYARYELAKYYQKTGKKDEAAKLFGEIKSLYPDAIDHQGRLLSDAMKPNATE